RIRLVAFGADGDGDFLVWQQLAGAPATVLLLLHEHVALDAVDEHFTWSFPANRGCVYQLRLKTFDLLALLVPSIHDKDGRDVADDLDVLHVVCESAEIDFTLRG